MKQSLRGMLWLAVLSCAHAATAREQSLEGLRRFEMPPYTIVAASEEEARLTATFVAEVDQVLYRKYDPQPREPTPPTTLLLLSGKQIDRFLADGKVKAQRAAAASTSNYLLLPAGVGPRRLRHAVYHQLAHLYTRTQFEETLPFWFEEGFALMIEALRIDGDEAVIGEQRFDFRDRTTAEPQEGNRVMDKEGPAQTLPGWISLSRVFSCDDTCSEYANEGDRDRMRREQWVVVHRAMIGETEFGKQVASYIEMWGKQLRVEPAIRVFGSIDQLNRSTRAYAAREDFEVERVPFDKPEVSLREVGAFRPDEAAGVLASLASMHLPVLD